MRISFILLFAVVCMFQSTAQNRTPSYSTIPTWVKKISFDYNNTGMDADAEDGYVVVGKEKQMSLAHKTTYNRLAERVVNESGVQNESQVAVVFDPGYEKLIFHSIQIIRGTEVINKLAPTKIKVIQQETELDNFIYNGSLKAVLFLEDVRKGDIIEYSYSITGLNPIFNNKVSQTFSLQYSTPCYQFYYRVIIPKGRSIQVKNTLDTIKPIVSSTSDNTSYEWTKLNVPALHLQDKVPIWFEAYPEVTFSEYKNWEEVSQWAANLFPPLQKVPISIVKKVREIETADSTIGGRIGKSLQFVQDEIRYMGMEMGVHSHKPADPDKVLAQRFGDCKEKSYLLACILNAMNIKSEPVLINTEYQQSISNWLPGPFAFDHCTVRVLFENEWHYFDPTISYQRGPLNTISYPDYKLGLPISDSTTALCVIPFHESGQVEIYEVFDIPSFTGKSRLSVTTDYSGTFADDIRYDFNTTSKSEMMNSYKRFYADYFKFIEADSITTIEDFLTGHFIVKEYYTIDSIWSKKNALWKANFSGFVVGNVIKNPREHDRTMPFAVNHPTKYHEVVTVNLFKDWSITPSRDETTCSAFKMNSEFSCTGNKIKMEFYLETLRDHVNPDEAKSFFSSMDIFEGSQSYELTYNENNNLETSVSEVKTSDSSLSSLFKFLLIGVLVFSILKITKRI